MKLASFSSSAGASWGVVDGHEVVDVGSVLAGRLPDLLSAIRADALAEVAETVASAPRLNVSDITWLPVIPNPGKILCVGLNYETHRKETGRSEVEKPTIFARFANSQTGHLCPIPRPRVSTDLD